MRLISLLVLLAVGACGPAEVGDVGSPAPALDQPVVVTFEVNEGDRFRVLLIERADIEAAHRLLAGDDVPDIPNGLIVRETGINEGWSWSLDPTDFEFADVTMEVCDGVPADVENGTLTGDRYCPWSARAVAVDPAPQP